MGLKGAEYVKFRRACRAVAEGLGGEMTPTERAKAGFERGRDRYALNPSLHNRTPRKAYTCPAKIWRTHPDASVRALAEAQSREVHMLNDVMIHGEVHQGKCWAKACRPIRNTGPGLDAQLAAQAKGELRGEIL